MFVGGLDVILSRVEGNASLRKYHLSQELKKVLEWLMQSLSKTTAG